ncbi:U7 snRNA-associated Sm-like protein LSm11 [Centruroides vittatus]|uniref:U7 snRNA-associated Sm-like protein LSm11 n=1 Tax=Centruroides vittatus TaxID=120091 RepID=UPI00351029D0
MAAEEVDLLSSDFDPELALRSTNVALPFPNAKTFDNLAQYRNFAIGKIKSKPKSKTEQITEENEKVLQQTSEEPSTSNISKHQKQDVIIRMKTSFNKGPLYILTKCVQECKRIKVVTRNHTEIRGICTGYIIAFDKHWNLAMRDVDEVYKKSAKLKTPILRNFNTNDFFAFQQFDSETLEKSEEDASFTSLSFHPVSCFVSGKCICTVGAETKIKKNKEIKQMVQDAHTDVSLDTSTSNTENLKTLTTDNDASNERVNKRSENLDFFETCEKDSVTMTIKEHPRKKKGKKKFDTCKRHLSQVFIRGDNIVLIQILECS